MKAEGATKCRVGYGWVRFGQTLAMVFVFFGVMGTFAWAGSESACEITSLAAYKACKNEIKDDYWINVGICANFSDSFEKQECLDELEGSMAEGFEGCKEQRFARLEVCGDIGDGPYDPQAEPENFVDPRDIGTDVDPNPYLPLIPGATWVYEGGDETITVTVTNQIIEILGVPCVVVRDVVEEDGELIEDTDDWFAQDLEGNVWYFGEISFNFEDGQLADIEGSWKAGVEGDKQGYLIKRFPVVGEVFRQEFSLGNAEDMAEVESLSGSAQVPAAECVGDCLVTREYTPIEPDFYEYKYYAPGIGMILEVDPETGERVELVEHNLD